MSDCIDVFLGNILPKSANNMQSQHLLVRKSFLRSKQNTIIMNIPKIKNETIYGRIFFHKVASIGESIIFHKKNTSFV